ncbi:MAG: 50S ribosomal protein L23 [Candidatus Aenigmarchaeota archaeon]|nr:50S ribosomal protein L23 [Candidatus Aenigmarchaeota archaeon]
MNNQEKQPIVDPWTIINYPLLTEKSISKIETENKMVFIVNRNANKKQIKWAAEKALGVKIDKVTTMIDQKGRKKAWITINKKDSALDVATRLGML